jgi:hypothetical protein
MEFRILSHPVAVAMFTGLMVMATGVAAQSSTSENTISSPSHGNLALTKKKKAKKTKKKGDEEFGVEGLAAGSENEDSGVGVHREQEGVGVPYKAEISLGADLSFLQSKIADSTDPAKTLTNYSVDVEWLFIFGKMHLGPDFTYRSESSAVPNNTVDTNGKAIVKTDESKTSSYAIGGLFKWSFGNIDQSDIVPYAYCGLAYRSAETDVGDAKPLKSSGSVIKAGGGINIFLSSHVAFSPHAEFRRETDKNEQDTNAATTETMGLKTIFGIAVFL